MGDEDSTDVTVGKEIAFYAATLAAWTATRMELDRSKLTLSVAGIGLLVTVMTAVGVDTTADFILFIFATLFFAITIACVLYIFQRNSKYVKRIAKGDARSDEVLKCLDNFSSVSFFIAILCTMAIGLSQGLASINSKQETFMSEEKENAVQGGTFKKSLEGLGDLKPANGNDDPKSGGTDQANQSSESESGSSDK